MDAISQLNIHHGAKEATTIDPVILILIRINQLVRSDMMLDELFETTRRVWRLRPREAAKYAFAAFESVCPGGTMPSQTPDHESVGSPERWEFKAAGRRRDPRSLPVQADGPIF